MLRKDDLNAVPHDAVVNTICLKMLDHKHSFPVNVSVLEDNREISVGMILFKNPSPRSDASVNVGRDGGSCLIRRAGKTKQPHCKPQHLAPVLFHSAKATQQLLDPASSALLVISVCRLLKAIWVGSGTIGQPWKADRSYIY